MKKTFLMVVTVSLISFASCTDNEVLPEEMLIELDSEIDTRQECCGEGSNPPPPPPPPGGGVGG
jgi:hypothetical protein